MTRELGLTEKQEAALSACVYPQAGSSWIWWAEARASWAGPRKTLGSLQSRGLVTYDDVLNEGPHWEATEAGRELLTRIRSERIAKLNAERGT